jgi:uncharacterized protein (DUF2236 family)
MAALFGIPASALPADWAHFEAYNRAMWDSDSLGVSDLSRELAHRVLRGRGSWVPVPYWYRAMTASWIPERLRNQFALQYGAREEDAASQARRWLPRIYPSLPDAMRFVGPFQEAGARLQGGRLSALTQASNRFWMGQPRMMFAGSASFECDEMPQPLQ